MLRSLRLFPLLALTVWHFGCLNDVNEVAITSDGRLQTRPGEPAISIASGTHTLGLASGRDGLLYVPAGYDASVPAPLVLLLHGAGGRKEHFESFSTLADEAGVIFLMIDSRGYTWDLFTSGFGPDVLYLEQALAFTFERCALDQSRPAIGGFSDGATYALSLDLINGDLFTHIMAFSPGGASAPGRMGAPRIFISHGAQDEVLNIDDTSRMLVPDLERLGYAVTYVEFEGYHELPIDIVEDALAWLIE